MIQSLEDIIKKSDNVSMIYGKVKYKENCPYSSEQISKDNSNYIKMKYYEGLILPEEHRNYSSNESAYAIYDKYIFNEFNILSDEFTIISNDIDNIIKFRMVLSKESPYLEKFDQLIIRIYFENNKDILAGLVQNILGNSAYGWAKEYIKLHLDDKQSLIFQHGTKEYNRLFGITEEEESEDNIEKDSFCKNEKTISDEKDWISMKFGG